MYGCASKYWSTGSYTATPISVMCRRSRSHASTSMATSGCSRRYTSSIHRRNRSTWCGPKQNRVWAKYASMLRRSSAAIGFRDMVDVDVAVRFLNRSENRSESV